MLEPEEDDEGMFDEWDIEERKSKAGKEPIGRYMILVFAGVALSEKPLVLCFVLLGILVVVGRIWRDCGIVVRRWTFAVTPSFLCRFEQSSTPAKAI